MESWLARVDPAAVEAFAELDLTSFLPTARPWLGASVTPDVEKAIGALIDLCRGATRRGVPTARRWCGAMSQ